MFRLVAYAPDEVKRFSVDRDEMLIGTALDCEITLNGPGIAARHARLRRTARGIIVSALEGEADLVVNGDSTRAADLEILDEIRFGDVSLLLEDVSPPREQAPPPERPVSFPPKVSASSMIDHLARVASWILSDAASGPSAETLMGDLLDSFGGGALFLFQGETDRQGIKFVVATDATWLGSGNQLLEQVSFSDDGADDVSVVEGELGELQAWIVGCRVRALERSNVLVVALPWFRPSTWSPISGFKALAAQLVLGLVHHVGTYEPILVGGRRRRDLILAPGLVLGESPAIKKTISELRAVIDSDVSVLLSGEPAVSRRKLAESIHLSSSRSEQPFVIVECAGTQWAHIEADLFGSEITGKEEPLVREGRLCSADGGTLYLADVDQLPMSLQDRLVRFLRTNRVEPRDSLEHRVVDVRVMSSSSLPLTERAERDDFRIDLAHLLGQFTVEVPALRDRREELPLLIQSALNRCCHEAGKRIHGISVNALDSMTAYDYPGNLAELDSIIRRLVYLCPTGEPIDQQLLPREVRLAKVAGRQLHRKSELDLERLVSHVERGAIREALRRSQGNKSEAARQLNLSRNGLALKIQRLEID